MKKNWFVISKMTRISIILTRVLKSLKHLHFDWFLFCKVFNVWPKKVQRSHLSWHWRVVENLKKTDLWFGKWHEEFGKFSQEHWKVSKLGLWWDPFVQSRKCMSLKFTGVICHDNEEWRKIWRGIDLSFQNWHEEFDKFWPKQLKI